jgi:hypothetical protein
MTGVLPIVDLDSSVSRVRLKSSDQKELLRSPSIRAAS